MYAATRTISLQNGEEFFPNAAKLFNVTSVRCRYNIA